jgi:hypothetical protein
MHSRYPRKSRPWRMLLGLAAIWFIWSAAGATAQLAANGETTPPAETGAQNPPRDTGCAAPETYQGTPVGFTADGHPFRGNPDAPLTMVE